MRIKTDFPRPVRKIENTWIPLSAGCRLAASIWLPEDAEEDPVPAILEYLPYRKDDRRAVADSTIHPYFAGHGYASVRVDMRGSGASDGILLDEYLTQEQDDALNVLAWIAAQPWCTGAIGMMGISWGGFNSLQIAARQPPELKAIVTVASTDDRYADDVHYRGGCVLASNMLSWAARMFLMNGLPPDPQIVGERWRAMWLDRLQHTPHWVEAWMSHQRRDAFWQHGSVCENYADITCAVYAVGGWADGYTNAVPRLLAGLPGPRKGLIGPWSHNYPHNGLPGPAIGFLQECLRWWDHWLKGIDTGIMDEPMLRAWIQDSVTPRPFYDERPGRWVAETSWPPPSVQMHTYWLNEGSLEDQPGAGTQRTYRGSQFTGAHAGSWCPYGQPADLPLDQRAEDGRSLTFDSAPLEEAMDILGSPEVTLTLATDRPDALLALRLCDIAPDGESLLVSRGCLNLTHRDSHEHPLPLQPGKRYNVTIPLDVIGARIPAGHRWRLSVSPTYWPQAWPSPEPVTLTVFTGQGSQLQLPVRTPQSGDTALAPFAPPECSAAIPLEQVRPASRTRALHHDVANRQLQIVDSLDTGHKRLLASDLEFYSASQDVYTIVEDDPLSATVRCEGKAGLSRGAWRVRVETSSTMSADAETFYLTHSLDAYEGNTRIFTKTGEFRIPRDRV